MLAGNKNHKLAGAAFQPIILAAAAVGQIPPQQDFTLREEVVVKNDGGKRQHVGNIEFFLVGGNNVLHQQLVFRLNGCFFFLRDGRVPVV